MKKRTIDLKKLQQKRNSVVSSKKKAYNPKQNIKFLRALQDRAIETGAWNWCYALNDDIHSCIKDLELFQKNEKKN